MDALSYLGVALAVQVELHRLHAVGEGPSYVLLLGERRGTTSPASLRAAKSRLMVRLPQLKMR